MSYFVLFCWLFIRCMQAVVDQLIISVGEERANLSAIVYL